MRRMRWIAVSALVVVTTSLIAPAARSEDHPALSGLYLCEGTDPTGNDYQGVVRIATHRNTVILTWMFPDGIERAALRPSAVGVGIPNGSSLSVSYYSGTMAGLVVYRIEQESQRLIGEWTVAGGDGTLYSEILTKLAVESTDPAVDEPPPPQPRKKPTPTGRGTTSL
jgi:hypothetical protein